MGSLASRLASCFAADSSWAETFSVSAAGFSSDLSSDFSSFLKGEKRPPWLSSTSDSFFDPEFLGCLRSGVEGAWLSYWFSFSLGLGASEDSALLLAS